MTSEDRRVLALQVAVPCLILGLHTLQLSQSLGGVVATRYTWSGEEGGGWIPRQTFLFVYAACILGLVALGVGLRLGVPRLATRRWPRCAADPERGVALQWLVLVAQQVGVLGVVAVAEAVRRVNASLRHQSVYATALGAAVLWGVVLIAVGWAARRVVTRP